MGTATWANGVPDTQTIVLHINDADECDALYGGNPGTCFVLPGSAPESKPPTVLKDATPSFDRTFKWSISKSVDKTSVKQIGGTATFNYTVTVTHDGGTDSNWQVNGKIVVTNPNVFDIDHADVTDAVNDGGTCSVTGGADVTLPSGMTTFNYSCTYASAPNPAAGTNTATVKWPDQGTLEAGTATYDATFDFGATSPNSIDECVSVSDSVQGLLGTVCVGDANPTTFSYSRTVPVPAFDCVSYDNTATFTTKDTGSTGSAGQTVTVCGPAKTGALTMGFWQNNNGQGIIKGGAATAGVCNSGTWLRQYAPFQDLSATATCAQVATYVYNVIKAANASGAAMNAMLKAQMLATALDVYFSDPALGGNKINAPSPVGGRSIDLTLINKPIGGATFENTSGAFGGATCKTVLDLLSYAASQSNSGGTVWYGQVKATQELAKDTFDAINNQKAFGC